MVIMRLFPGGDLVTGRIVRTLKQFGKTQNGKSNRFKKQNVTKKAAFGGRVRWGWMEVARNQMKAESYLEAGRDEYYFPKALQCEHEVLSVLRLSWLTATNLEVCSLCILARFNFTLTKKEILLVAACFCCKFEKNLRLFFLMSEAYFIGIRCTYVRSVHDPTGHMTQARVH